MTTKKMLKVYVAGRFTPDGIDVVRMIQQALVKAGHFVTHDWTQEEAKPHSDAEKRDLAGADLMGVRSADVVVVVPSVDGGRGLYVEMGAALALGTPVIIYHQDGSTIGKCIFDRLPFCQEVGSLEAIVAALDGPVDPRIRALVSATDLQARWMLSMRPILPARYVRKEEPRRGASGVWVPPVGEDD